MQFAGQRTDMELRPLGEPLNVLIKLTPDILPEPEAILVTGITPQITIADGVSEAEFIKRFQTEAVKADTIFVGFNSIRFDDEFMRFLFYRNFYDAYEWQTRQGCSRWDILDVVRMTRALRPEGIQWPVDSSGQASNRLTLLTGLNKLDHVDAHDALSDVGATIALTKLIRQKQPKLFEYLLSIRTKQQVAKLIEQERPFVYTSGSYPGEFEKTTVAATISQLSEKQTVLVYDLRFDPKDFMNLSVDELAALWSKRHDDPSWQPFPVKTLQINRAPAVAPLSVLDNASQQRLKLDMKLIEKHYRILRGATAFTKNLEAAQDKLNRQQRKMWKQQQTEWMSDEQSVDAQLYDGFFDDHDKKLMTKIHSSLSSKLSGFESELHDPRLKALLLLYKARNFPASLSDEEQTSWQTFCQNRLLSGNAQSRLARYMKRLSELVENTTTKKQSYLLEELILYGESIMPGELA
jgi:exodeoxyribonuclease I